MPNSAPTKAEQHARAERQELRAHLATATAMAAQLQQVADYRATSTEQRRVIAARLNLTHWAISQITTLLEGTE